MQTLSTEYLQTKAPAIFAESSANMSTKYQQIPTFKILEALKTEGFNAVKVQQQRKLDPARMSFAKHLIRLRHDRDLITDKTHVPEVVLMNSHDGASAYRMILGVFRVVCSNGLVVASSTMASINVRHTGQASQIDSLITGAHTLIDKSRLVLDKIEDWRSKVLNEDQKREYFKGAFDIYREGREDLKAYDTYQLGQAYRRADVADDLWTVFNKTQENLIHGNFYINGAGSRYRRARRITSIDKDTKLNQALWQYTNDFKLN